MQNADYERSAEGQESLKRHLEWLYPDPEKPCICQSGWRNTGSLHGIRMGYGWVRLTTEPGCYHHGTVAQRFYDDNLRRFRKTGNWDEFHIDRDEWERTRIDGGGA